MKPLALGAALTLACNAAVHARDMFGPGPGGPLTEFNQSAGTNGVFMSTITVNADIRITDISVTLLKLKHTWSGDLVIQLQKVDGYLPSDPAHPSPILVTLVHRVGSIAGTFGAPNPFGKIVSGNLEGDDYTFGSTGGNIWTTALGLAEPTDVIPGGMYQTSGPVTAPGDPWGANTGLTAFNNFNSRGTWKLIITDMSSPNTGMIDGWTLTIIPAPPTLALLALTALIAPRRRRLHS